MKAKRRLEITRETHELTIIRFRKSTATMLFCAECQNTTQHLSVVEVAAILSISESDVRLLAESKRFHATENKGGIFFCGYSPGMSTNE